MAEYNLGTAHGTVKIDSDTSGVEKANKSVQTLKDGGEKTGAAWDKVGNRIGIAGVAIAGGLGVAVKKSIDFEAELSGIRAVTGATGDTMDSMRAKALQLGADTSFSAGEAAGAMSELAKAGVTTDDILGGAADATVALAAATGIDLTTSATIASDAMNTFGLKAKELPGVADTLAQAANASSIDVSDLGMALSQAGAVANLVGLSLEDTASAIGQLGNAGIKGSDAGTSLKTMLSNLQPTTEKAATAMSDLGLITEDGTNKFYDAQGNLKSMRDIQELLHNSTKNLSAAQKQQALETIFGSDAIRAAAVLADGGAKAYDKFGKQMEDSGTAAEQAKIRQDNLKGSLEQLGGSLETAGIMIGSALMPMIRGLADGLTGLVNWFTQLDKGTQQWIAGGLAVVAGMLLMGAAIIKTVRFMQELKGAISTIISALFRKNAAESASAASSSRSALRSSAAWVASAVKTVAQWAWMAVTATAKAVATGAVWIAQSTLAATRVAAAWAAAATKTVAQWVLMGLRAAAQAAIVAGAWLISTGTAIATSLASMAIAVATTLAGWIAMAAQAVISAAIIAISWLIAFWPILLVIVILALVVAAVIYFWDDIVAAFKAAAAWIGQVMTNIWNAIKAAWDFIVQAFQNALNFIKNLMQQIWNAIKSAWDNVLNFFRQIPGWIGNVFSSALNWLINAGRNIINGLWNGIKAIWNGAISFIRSVPGMIGNVFSNAGSWLLDAGRALLQGLWNGISGAAGWLWDQISGWVSSVISGVKDFFGIGSPSKEFADIGHWLMIGLENGISDSANKAVTAAEDAARSVVGTMSDNLDGRVVEAQFRASLSEGTLAALSGGDLPVSGADAAARQVASSASGSQAAVDKEFQKIINMEFKTYNPVAEKASDSEARKIRAAAAVGAF